MTIYRLFAFQRVGYEEVLLPEGDSTFDNPAGPVANGMVATLAGGAIDTYGESTVAPVAMPFLVTWTGVVTGDGTVYDPRFILRERMQELRGLVGHRGGLVRKHLLTNTEYIAVARVVSVRSMPSSPSDRGIWERIEMQFMVLSGWESSYSYDQVYGLDVAGGTGATEAIELDISDSNRPQSNVVFEVTAGSAALTLFRVSVPLAKADWYWVGTLEAGNTLRIDCGAMSVLQEGIENYDGFFLTDNHKSAHWLQLVPQSTESWSALSAAPPMMMQQPEAGEIKLMDLPVDPPPIVGSIYYEDNGSGADAAQVTISYKFAYQ